MKPMDERAREKFQELASTNPRDVAIEKMVAWHMEALTQVRRETLEEASKIAIEHCSYDKKNELFAKYPAGDQVISMASYISKAIDARIQEGGR